ncbi:MAG TPA: YhgE/Pip domain-containing protein [Microlunatus sp.]|jgi:putative membrane protein|nr:YhgE/Pip domain-containing protein [Microlunatus sp.]
MSSPDRRAKGHQPVPRWLVPMVAVILTAIAGGVVLWAVQGHQNSGPAVPLAIVNLDAPVTQGTGTEAKTIAAGRQLAGSLSSPASGDETPLSWQLVDSDDAATGLQDGTYYGVLTIPKDFSAAVTSTSGSDPQQAELKLVSNDAASAAVAALAQLSVNQAARTLGDQVTNNYVDAMLTNLTTINKNLTSSATSASSLAGSAHELAGSSHSLADSADQIADGASSLDAGTKSLLSGTQTLASGAQDAANGAAQVASGSEELATAADELAAGADKTADGADDIAEGASDLARLADGTAKGAGDLATATGRQQTGLARTDKAAGAHATGAAAVATRADRIAAECPPTTPRDYCERVADLSRRIGIESRAASALDRLFGIQVDRGTAIDKGATALDKATGRLDGGLAELSSAAGKVATGADDVSDGATQLDRAAGTLASGAVEVATGTRSVADGAEKTEAGVQEMAVAADQLASGTTKLDSGAHQLADGADQLADGADQLASGLTSGAKQVPSYTDDQRKQLDTVVTTPVTVAASADNPSTVAAGLVPVVLGLALWIGTLMMLLTRPPVPVGLSWAQASPARRVLFGLAPVVLVGLVQAGLLLGLVAIAKVPISSPLGLVLFAGLGVLAFAATNQALVSVFSRVGRLVSLAFALVEAAALGGLMPIETAPAALQLLNTALPLPQFVSGAAQLMLGGRGNLASACLVLSLWTVLALGASLLAASRRSSRVGGVETVHPSPAPAPSTA